MIETAIFLVCVVVVAIACFILVDKAGQPDPIPLILKLVILLIALFAVAHQLGYA